MDKYYTLYAGVNGAGKTTFYHVHALQMSSQQPRVNVDEIVRDIGDFNNIEDQFKAGKIAAKNIKNYFEKGISFNQETTLCGRAIINNIKKAQENNYKIILHYIGLENVELAKERVRNRVLKGGHGIPDEIIEKRYYESLNNLKTVIPFCHKVKIYDNTEELSLICRIEDNLIKWKLNSKWLDPIIYKYELEQIKNDLMLYGITPTPMLITDVKNLNRQFNKFLTVEEICRLFKERKGLDKTGKELLVKVGSQFINEKTLQRQKSTEYLPEI